jgi:hypothetical protein
MNKNNYINAHHHLHKLGDGLDEGPDPFSVGLRVDGAAGRAGDHTPRTLLGLYLHNMKGQKEMLWAATLWVETVPNNELPEDLDDPHAHSEELAEEPCLCGCQPDATLDVLGDFKKSGISSSASKESVHLSLYSMGYTFVTLVL